jgi:hypothetical protein
MRTIGTASLFIGLVFLAGAVELFLPPMGLLLAVGAGIWLCTRE